MKKISRILRNFYKTTGPPSETKISTVAVCRGRSREDGTYALTSVTGISKMERNPIFKEGEHYTVFAQERVPLPFAFSLRLP